jgi:hypothetical protein
MAITVMRELLKEIELPRSGLRVTVRPLGADDAVRLLEFFLASPEEDRYFLKEDFTSPEVIGTGKEYLL